MFRFQTGAIKSQRGTEVYNDLAEFRFQTGAIKSKLFQSYAIEMLKRFDSKLVRLKVVSDKSMETQATLRFDSKLVRLKVDKQVLIEKTRQSFDSKLVRLKVGIIINNVRCGLVSIPNWCD